MSRFHIQLIVAVAFLVFAGGAVVATAEALSTLWLSDSPNSSSISGIEQSVDLQDCEEECRRRFGFVPYGYGGRSGRSPGYWIFARCLANCDRAYWDSFDREIDELEKK